MTHHPDIARVQTHEDMLKTLDIAKLFAIKYCHDPIAPKLIERIDNAAVQYRQQAEVIERMGVALAFYAAGENHDDGDESTLSTIEQDMGWKAKEALTLAAPYRKGA